jgi:ABC-type antimicrobial peptide transport system permease subunit
MLGSISGIIVCWFISFIKINIALPGQALPCSAAHHVLKLKEATLEFVLLPELFTLAVFVCVVIGVVSGYLLANKSLTIRPAQFLRMI